MIQDNIDPNEHAFVTAYRELGESDNLPDMHSLLPWAQKRLRMQGEEAHRRFVEEQKMIALLRKLGRGPRVLR